MAAMVQKLFSKGTGQINSFLLPKFQSQPSHLPHMATSTQQTTASNFTISCLKNKEFCRIHEEFQPNTHNKKVSQYRARMPFLDIWNYISLISWSKSFEEENKIKEPILLVDFLTPNNIATSLSTANQILEFFHSLLSVQDKMQSLYFLFCTWQVLIV